MHTYIHYIHTYICMYAYTYIHTYIHTCMHTYIYTYVYTYTYIYACIHTHSQVKTTVQASRQRDPAAFTGGLPEVIVVDHGSPLPKVKNKRLKKIIIILHR